MHMVGPLNGWGPCVTRTHVQASVRTPGCIGDVQSVHAHTLSRSGQSRTPLPPAEMPEPLGLRAGPNLVGTGACGRLCYAGPSLACTGGHRDAQGECRKGRGACAQPAGSRA